MFLHNTSSSWSKWAAYRPAFSIWQYTTRHSAHQCQRTTKMQRNRHTSCFIPVGNELCPGIKFYDKLDWPKPSPISRGKWDNGCTNLLYRWLLTVNTWIICISSMLNSKFICENVHSQSRRMIMVSPEPDFWIHAVSVLHLFVLVLGNMKESDWSSRSSSVPRACKNASTSRAQRER